ncbi:uncharacterized protein LAJ45_06264 [Morchella importuna]|uniref:uncharacterized protein n=1 Tax=Morchella importuna TaxID=1174673 RepID=UPI001E8D3D70|nr:uncharacterized protein LAJ45_06264 [Morchella importuna]KAH8149633.1 hypothetical protein LAJ45_06264 [Morchella importuna]
MNGLGLGSVLVEIGVVPLLLLPSPEQVQTLSFTLSSSATSATALFSSPTASSLFSPSATPVDHEIPTPGHPSSLETTKLAGSTSFKFSFAYPLLGPFWVYGCIALSLFYLIDLLF